LSAATATPPSVTRARTAAPSRPAAVATRSTGCRRAGASASSRSRCAA